MANKQRGKKRGPKTGRAVKAAALRAYRNGTAPGMARKPAMHVPMELVMQTCSITNPFCEESVGAKYPDESYVKSLTYDIMGVTQYLSLAAGSGTSSSIFVGDVVQYGPGVVGTYPTVTTTNLSALQAMPTGADQYRVTSWGLSLRCVGSKMNQTGMCRIRLVSPFYGASLNSYAANTTLADAIYDIPMSRLIDRDVHIIPKPVGPGARLFRSVSQVTPLISGWINPGWQVVIITCDGIPASSSTLEIKAYYHFEYLPDEGSILSTYATKPPANNEAVKLASQSVSEKIGSFFDGAGAALDKAVNNKATKYFLAMVGSYFGGPNAGIAAYNAPKMIQNMD